MIYIADAHNLLTDFDSGLAIVSSVVILVLGVINIRNRWEKGKDADTIRTLQNSNSALLTQQQVDASTVTNQDKEIAVLKQTAQVLQDMKTQAPDINRLIIQLSEQHKEMMSAMSKVMDSNGKMTKEIGNIAKALSKEPA